jgi:hypothetical protein
MKIATQLIFIICSMFKLKKIKNKIKKKLAAAAAAPTITGTKVDETYYLHVC